MKAYRIPQHNEDPSDEMVDFLSENTEDWDGDDSGITLGTTDGSAGDELGGPGDWVVRLDNGQYRIRNHEWMLNVLSLGLDFKTYEGPEPEIL